MVERFPGKRARIALAGLAALGFIEIAGVSAAEKINNQPAGFHTIVETIKWPLTLAEYVQDQKTPETSAIGWEHVSPQGYVNDFARLLTPDEKQIIENQLIKLRQDTTAEVAVVTVNNMNGTYIEDYAVKLFEDWRIGKRWPDYPNGDNGLLLLIAVDEKQVKIEVGYGLEPDITDGWSGRILDQMTPFLKTGDYTRGIKAGVNAIDARIRATH